MRLRLQTSASVIVAAMMVATAPNVTAQSVTCIIEGACPNSTHEGGGVAVHVRCSVSTGVVTSLNLLSMTKDDVPASPAQAPVLTGLNAAAVPVAEELILYWQTAPGDSGSWELCFEGANDLGDTDTACYTVDVGVPSGNHVAWKSRRLEFVEGGGPIAVNLLLAMTNTIQVQGILLPFIMRSTSGGAFFASPVTDPGQVGDGTGDLLFSPAFVPVFMSRSTNTYANDAISPDTILAGLISFGAGLDPGLYDDALTMFAEIAEKEGIITIDSIFLPGSQLTFNDPTGAAIFPTFSPGCFAVTLGDPCPVESTGDLNCSGAITSADIIAMVHVVFLNVPERSCPCVAASDVNCSGQVNAADIIYLVNTVFKSGVAPCDVCPYILGGTWECE